MASFLQLLKTWPRPYRWAYVGGAERILVEDTIDLLTDYWELVPTTLSVRELGEGSVQAAIFQESLDDVTALVVREADRIKNWKPILELVQERPEELRLIFVGSEIRMDTKEARYRPFVETKGAVLIECPLMNTFDRLFDYVSLTVRDPSTGQSLDEDTIGYLVERYEEDFLGLRNIGKQLMLFSRISGGIVKVVAEAGGAYTLVSVLVNGDKDAAWRLLATGMRPSAFPLILRSLERDLTREILVVDALRQGLRGRDLYAGCGVPRAFLPRLLERIDRERVDLQSRFRRLALVAHAATRFEQGETTGVLERLVALW